MNKNLLGFKLGLVLGFSPPRKSALVGPLICLEVMCSKLLLGIKQTLKLYIVFTALTLHSTIPSIQVFVSIFFEFVPNQVVNFPSSFSSAPHNRNNIAEELLSDSFSFLFFCCCFKARPHAL